jgi:hypothetical protein
MVKSDKKLCFVIGPIGRYKSRDRTHADTLLNKIIKPTFAKNFRDFKVVRADNIARPGMIDSTRNIRMTWEGPRKHFERLSPKLAFQALSSTIRSPGLPALCKCKSSRSYGRKALGGQFRHPRYMTPPPLRGASRETDTLQPGWPYPTLRSPAINLKQCSYGRERRMS